VPDLYTGRKNGAYYYFHGWNIRAYVAYIIGIVPNFYGFLHNMGVWAPIDVTRFYYFAYPIGVGLSVFAFWLCNYFYPPAISFPMKEWHEPKDYIRPEEYLESPIQDEDLSSHEASVSGEEKKTANERISLA
jgi:NCS1 family nucleobase:cation symporter-1